MPFQLSDEQEAIIRTFDSCQDNLLIQAAPGSGKTTTLQALWNHAAEQRVLYLAFNKAIVEEMREKVGVSSLLLSHQGKAICTFNSLGAQVLNSGLVPKPTLNSRKVFWCIQRLPLSFDAEREESIKKLNRVVQCCKSTLLPLAYTKHDIEAVMEYYDLDGYSGIEKHARIVLETSLNDTTVIDFDDQILFPCVYPLSLPRYDLVLVDEAQDMNAVKRALLLRGRETEWRNTRFVFVGDCRQSIYGFAGALVDSMPSLAKEFSCVSLPLTVTRRCAQAIVTEAQTVYPDDIRAARSACSGDVYDAGLRYGLDLRQRCKPVERDYSLVISALHDDSALFSSDDLILCRTVAPLVHLAYELLHRRIPCYIRGRSIGEGFISYIERSKCIFVDDFLMYLEQDIAQQREQARRKGKDIVLQSLEDKEECLTLFALDCMSNSTQGMIAYIRELFEKGKGIQLSSIHRAKGLEADRVGILAPDLLPHPLATRPWQRVQEDNLKYVAITRAKRVLVYL